MLELGSGTGQHAVHFAAALPHLRWQTSDLPAAHAGIRAWIAESGLANVMPPLALDAADVGTWPTTLYDAVFTANTFHIMAWPQVQACFASLPRVLAPRAKLVVYGPFNYAGSFTSPSNEAFDASLKAVDPRRGIRDIEAVHALAANAGLAPIDDIAMPANNRCVVWALRG